MSGTSSLKEFSYKDLMIATRNFHPDGVSGEGGFGTIYKGWVDEKTLAPSRSGIGMKVAVKIWNPISPQGFQEWQSEVNFLGRHYHPNIISLLGYCWEDKRLALVYEFMQKGSLASHLFSGCEIQLSWNVRLKIAIEAARGLAYLHTLEKKIIHRDFKTTNILLDKNYHVKLSDFGLAILGPSSEESYISTNVLGTLGYCAPEYLATGTLYLKSDVYGFGVVLLELLTGLRTIDRQRSPKQQNLVDWLKPILSLKNKLSTIMDVRMEGRYPIEAAFQVAQLCLKCLESNPQSRLSMKEAVEVLKDIEALEDETRRDGSS